MYPIETEWTDTKVNLEVEVIGTSSGEMKFYHEIQANRVA